MKKLPPHLQKLSDNLNKGLDIDGKKMTKSQKQNLGKLLDADYYLTGTNKRKQRVKRRK